MVFNDCLLFTEIGANIHNVIGYIFLKMLGVPERLKCDGNLAQKSEYDQEYHNHNLQTNPRYREEELQDIYSNKISKRQ